MFKKKEGMNLQKEINSKDKVKLQNHPLWGLGHLQTDPWDFNSAI